MKLKLRGYIFSRNFMGERVPQHIQNIIVKDYCDKNDIPYIEKSSIFPTIYSYVHYLYKMGNP